MPGGSFTWPWPLSTARPLEVGTRVSPKSGKDKGLLGTVSWYEYDETLSDPIPYHAVTIDGQAKPSRLYRRNDLAVVPS